MTDTPVRDLQPGDRIRAYSYPSGVLAVERSEYEHMLLVWYRRDDDDADHAPRILARHDDEELEVLENAEEAGDG